MYEDLGCWLVLECGQGANVDCRGCGCSVMRAQNASGERSGADQPRDESDFSGRTVRLPVEFDWPSGNL